MGLFKSKKAAIERAKSEKTHEIICLYCFRNFKHEQVHFRALETMDIKGYKPEKDRKLDIYRARFQMGSAGELLPALAPEDFSEANKGYLKGILSSLRDDYNHLSTKRLCPYCHNSLPANAGFAPSTIISIVGASQAGKSVYLTSLIHTLKTVTSHNFDVFCTPFTGDMARKFKYDYEDPLLEKGYLLEPTQKDKFQEPLLFTFSFADGKKPEINIAFFDITEEAMLDVLYMELFATHVNNSSGVIFLVDPQQFRYIGRKIQILNRIEYDVTVVNDPTEALSSFVESYIHKQPNGISNIPTAMVLTKADLLEALSYEGEYIHPRSNIFNRFIHEGHFNLTESDIINYEVDEFLQLVDPNFRNALKRRFAHLGLFAVSALGTNPEVVRQRVSNFAPLRVDEPFLWILYKLGYIEGFYEGTRL